ncbi:MAG: TIGR03545 family protein [Helicobacteraceae bacterium]|jgi:uncharacterized protein (TIGR03545 family)/uncharacterized protein (TIGR03546 family)|nr:TIGR03545 family protein [Helicobacteraceae bacterium]
MYDVFIKFMRALNSADRSWQLSLALTLSVFVGLSPVFAPHLIVVCLLAFFLNINIGIFIVGCGIFAAIGYVADPWIESLGYYILTLPSLEGLWTSAYNNPWISLSNFNHTMILGSLAASLIIAIPAFFVFQILAKNYRFILSKIPLLRAMLEEPKPKKPSLFRWLGLIAFTALFGGAAVFCAFFLDAILKNYLESALSEPIGKQVTIDKLQTSFSPLSIAIEGVQIPDRKDNMKNAVAIERVAFNLDMARAFHKKVLIDELAANGVVIGQARLSPSKDLPNPPAREEVKSDAKSAESSEGGSFFNELSKELPDPKTILKNENLLTLTESKKIEARLIEIKTYWNEIAKTKFDKKAFADLEKQYNDLAAKAKKITNEKDLAEVLSAARTLQKALKERKEEYANLIKRFETERDEARNLIKRLAELPKEDYEALRKKYSFDIGGSLNLAEALLGTEIGDYIDQALEWYELARPYIKDALEARSQIKGDPLPKPERGKSRVVTFAEYDPKPNYLIKKATFDLTTKEGNLYLASLTGATDNQKITRAPMEALLKSERVKDFDSLSFNWIRDRYKNNDDRFALKWIGAYQRGFSKGKFFMKSAKMDWSFAGTIKEGRLESKLEALFRETALGVEKPKTELEKLLSDTLEGLNKFSVSVRLWGAPLKPDSSLSSDLDDQLKKRFKVALEKRLKAYEAELKAQIEAIAKKELAKLGAGEADIAAIEKVIKGEASLIVALEERTGKNLSEEGLKKELQKALQEKAKAEQKKLEDSLKQKLRDALKK